MSKITNDGLTRSGCFIAVSTTGNSGRQRVKSLRIRHTLSSLCWTWSCLGTKSWPTSTFHFWPNNVINTMFLPTTKVDQWQNISRVSQTCIRLAVYMVNVTRSQAVARIADRTVSQDLSGSRDAIGHVTIWFPVGHFLLVILGTKPLSLTVSEIFNLECHDL